MSQLASLMRRGMPGKRDGSRLQKRPYLRALPAQRLLLLLPGLSAGRTEHPSDPLWRCLCSRIVWYSSHISAVYGCRAASLLLTDALLAIALPQRPGSRELPAGATPSPSLVFGMRSPFLEVLLSFRGPAGILVSPLNRMPHSGV